MTGDPPEAPAVPGLSGRLLPVKVGTTSRQLDAQDIWFVAACENYTTVTCIDNQRLLVRRTMREWTRLLPPPQFIRVHRGLIVNLDRVGRVERAAPEATRLHPAGDSAAPFEVKRRYWPAFRARLDAWRVARHERTRGQTARSIAVLPFANLTRDRDNEVFCDGISEELLNVLAKIPGLHVAARTSSFHFKGRNLPVGEIARQLAVEYVVEGSLRRSGRRLRITAQLIAAARGFHLWSDNFDREPADILAVQEEIARQIARNLQLHLRDHGPAARPVDPEAHRLALEGRHFWNLRTGDGFVRAERAFIAALARDPDYAPAHAGLADLYVVRAMYRLADGAADASDDLELVRVSAERALELDPSLGEPHAALGFASFHAGRFGHTDEHFARAFAANPNYATGYQFYAWTLAGRGELDRALAEYARAIALDPLSFINLDRYGAMLALARRWAEALEINERAAALRPDLFVGNLSQRAPLLVALGRRDEAVAAARQVRELGRDQPFRRTSDADAIHALRAAGLPAEAKAYAAEVLARLPESNYLRGFVLAALGRSDEAIAAVGRPPPIMLPFLYWSDMWASARARPGYVRLMATLGRTAEYQRARAQQRAGT